MVLVVFSGVETCPLATGLNLSVGGECYTLRLPAIKLMFCVRSGLVVIAWMGDLQEKQAAQEMLIQLTLLCHLSQSMLRDSERPSFG